MNHDELVAHYNNVDIECQRNECLTPFGLQVIEIGTTQQGQAARLL